MNHSFESRVAGIPCLIEITHYVCVKGDSRADCSDDYYGYTEVEWEVQDSRGRAAPWLERKLDDADRRRIDEEAIDEVSSLQESALADW